MQTINFYIPLTNSNAIVQDDTEDAEDQQQFSKAHNKANEFASKLNSVK